VNVLRFRLKESTAGEIPEVFKLNGIKFNMNSPSQTIAAKERVHPFVSPGANIARGFGKMNPKRGCARQR
jgi:hypothetical protein